MTPTGNCYLSKVIPGHVTGHVTRPVIITQPYSVYIVRALSNKNAAAAYYKRI